MKKKTWNYLLIGLIVAVIIYAGVSSQQTAFLSGVGALSISNVQLLEGFDKLRDGEVWLMTLSPSQLNQRYHVDQLTPSESEQSDGTKTTKTATIEIDIDNQQCVYPLSTDSTATKIQKYEIYEWSNYRCGTTLGTQTYYNDYFKSQGKDINSIVYYGSFTPTFASDTCYVIYKSAETSVTKQLESSYVRIIAHVILEAEGEDSVSYDIDTEDSTSSATTADTLSMGKSGYLGDVAYVEWRGNLVNKNCEGLVNYRGAYYNNEWKLISTEYYDSYKNQKTAFENDMLTGEEYLYDEEQTRDVLSYYNSYYTNAISTRAVTNGNIESKTSTSGAKLRVEHTDLLQSPVISLYVVGDYLGIENRIAKGEIVSASDVACYDANQESTITIKVKNTGSYDSSYTLKADCTSPFQSESKDIGIAAGDTETESLLISSSGVTSKTTKTCLVGLYSAGNLLDTQSISACVNPVATCNTNDFCSKIGDSEVVYGCTGGALYVKDTCTSDEICTETGSTAQCVSEEIITTDCESSYFSFISDADTCNFCDSKFSTLGMFAIQCASFNAKDYFPYLFFVLGGLLTYWLIAMKYKPKREFKVIAVILSLVVAFILFLITDLIVEHWIISGIIATILLIVAYFVIKIGRYIP